MPITAITVGETVQFAEGHEVVVAAENCDRFHGLPG